VFAAGVELHDHPLYKNGSFVLQDKVSFSTRIGGIF